MAIIFDLLNSGGFKKSPRLSWVLGPLSH